jgi:hypothetical protein
MVNRAGRRPGAVQKSKFLHIRVTEAEYIRITREADEQSLNVTEYLRKIIFEKEVGR